MCLRGCAEARERLLAVFVYVVFFVHCDELPSGIRLALKRECIQAKESNECDVAENVHYFNVEAL